jgi:hypothetical protein
MRNITPELCKRAGGVWVDGWCSGAVCEICGSNQGLQRAHIRSRKKGGIETMDNILVACDGCHDHVKYAADPSGLACGTDRALEIVRRKNAELCGNDPADDCRMKRPGEGIGVRG